jgi:hypothetical protein
MMLSLLVLWRSRAPAVGVLALTPLFCLAQLLIHDYALRFAMIATGLLVVFSIWIAPEAMRTLRELRSPDERATRPQPDIG